MHDALYTIDEVGDISMGAISMSPPSAKRDRVGSLVLESSPQRTEVSPKVRVYTCIYMHIHTTAECTYVCMLSPFTRQLQCRLKCI